jgi:HSP20 family protein
LFDDFFCGFDVLPFGVPGEDRVEGFLPSVDVDESEKEVTVRIELPGMEEKDVDLLLTGDSLTIKGEKKKEMETEGKGYYQMERVYGAFNRVIPLPRGSARAGPTHPLETAFLPSGSRRWRPPGQRGKRFP